LFNIFGQLHHRTADYHIVCFYSKSAFGERLKFTSLLLDLS
jgi:hypothetical protein